MDKVKHMEKWILLSLMLLVVCSCSKPAADKVTETQNDTTVSVPAVAKLDQYRVVYQLNSGDEKVINGTLRNIKNAMQDARLKGKLQVQLVVHSGGVAAFKKGSPYKEALLELKKMGVLLTECENTLKERNIDKSELYPFVSYTPSGNGEIIIRQQQGWAIVHP